MKTEFRVALMNGKYGYGRSTWEALVNAVGLTKANLIEKCLCWNNPMGRWYAKNGNLVATVEIRN